MTRVAHLHPHLTPEQLTHRARQAADTTETRRFHLLRLIADGKTIQEAAHVVGLGYSYARRIVRRYNDEGPTAMRNQWREQKPPPPRPLLAANQLEALRQALADRAPDGGLWNGPKVAQWIKEQTGREHVYPQRGWEYLRLAHRAVPRVHLVVALGPSLLRKVDDIASRGTKLVVCEGDRHALAEAWIDQRRPI